MRKLGKLGVVLFSAAAMMGVTSNVFAANLGDPNDVKKFVKDSDPAIELNENTFLIGEGIFKLVHSDNTVEYVNSKTTKLKVTTVKEARKDAVANNIKKNQASSNSILATMTLGNHPKVAGTNVELQYGQAAGNICQVVGGVMPHTGTIQRVVQGIICGGRLEVTQEFCLVLGIQA